MTDTESYMASTESSLAEFYKMQHTHISSQQ